MIRRPSVPGEHPPSAELTEQGAPTGSAEATEELRPESLSGSPRDVEGVTESGGAPKLNSDSVPDTLSHSPEARRAASAQKRMGARKAKAKKVKHPKSDKGTQTQPTVEETAGVEQKKASESSAETKSKSSSETTTADEPMDAKARHRAEVESFLGPSLRLPVELPYGYTPNDRSIHPLFHIEVVHLDYAGPLDLLLYLIRRHDLDVLDIPIAFVTEKYLSMLEALEALEIDLAAEFLVLAAELAHIKSKMLLPAEKGVAVEENPEEEEEGDPRAELVRRLLEYQKYREAASRLEGREQLGRDIFPRVPPEMEKVEDLDPGLKQVSVFRLVELMARLLKDVPVHHEISYESFSIGERIQYVSAFGEAHKGRFTVMRLMAEIGSRAELVVTFIALLEMAKMGLVRIFSEAFHDLKTPYLAAKKIIAQDSSEAQSDELLDDLSDDFKSSESVQKSSAPEIHAEESHTPPESESKTNTEEAAQEEETVSTKLGIADDTAVAEEAHREAEALAALAEEVAAREPVDQDALDYPEEKVDDAAQESLEPLPEIWVELTDRRFQGDLVDDYR